MKLVVFDLDTALCPTNAMDGLAFERAVQDVSGDANFRIGTLPDHFNFRNALYAVKGKVPSALDITELRNRYNFHLRRQFLIRPSVIQANYALIERANSLQNHNENIVALVSTTTVMALQLKARAIGLLSEMLPIATSEDADTLPELLAVLKTRVKRSFGVQFESAQLVGSSVWLKPCESNAMGWLDPIEFMTQNNSFSQIGLYESTPYLA